MHLHIFVDVLSIVKPQINLNFRRLMALAKFVGVSAFTPINENARQAEIQDIVASPALTAFIRHRKIQLAGLRRTLLAVHCAAQLQKSH